MESAQAVRISSNPGNPQQVMGNQSKPEQIQQKPQQVEQQPPNTIPNQTNPNPPVQNNAQNQPLPIKSNQQLTQSLPLDSQINTQLNNTQPNGQLPNPTNMYSQPVQSQPQLALSKNQQFAQQSSTKDQQSKQTQTCQFKKFIVQLSEYTFTFQLTPDQIFIVKGQQQTTRNCLKSQFPYSQFTQQMKALFQNPQQMFSILQSAQDYLFYENSKLYFKIHLGQIQKHIHIPLKNHAPTDLQYIQKLQMVAFKYKLLSNQLTTQLNQQIASCTCKNHPKPQNSHQTTSPQKKDINPKAKTKIKIDRNWLSRASSTWPEPPLNFTQKSDNQFQPMPKIQQTDPLIQFEELMDKLTKMRNQFNLLSQEIQQKVLSSAGLKILKLKLMGLEKKKKDYFYELDLEKLKFTTLKCKNDIYNEIDEFLNDIRTRYTQIQTTVNLIRDEK